MDMVWRAQRGRNLALITDYISDYFSESSAESECLESTSEGEGEIKEGDPAHVRPSRSKTRTLPRYPRPHSHLLRASANARGRAGQRGGRGNKHARRWENSVFISTLYQLPEEELKRGFSIVPDHCSALTKLHTDRDCMQVWHSFTASSEEEQEEILDLAGQQQYRCGQTVREMGGSGCGQTVRETGGSGYGQTVREPGGSGCGQIAGKMGGDGNGRRVEREGVMTVGDRFRRIDRHIRIMMRHNKHLPIRFLQDVEMELTQFFTADPMTLVLALHSSTFYRMLVHGLCQYLGLKSTTVHKDGGSVMLVECVTNQFTPPPAPLASCLLPPSQC